MAKRVKKTREAAPGELRGIQILEKLQRLFARPDSRLDAQRLLLTLSPDAQAYARHLVMSGPSGNAAAAKACGLTEPALETAAQELESRIKGI
jgi:hypothetical protein